MAFTGSVKERANFTDEQKAIIDQMNKNSAAWHGADEATQKQLHRDNQQLAADLRASGAGADFATDGSGVWTVSTPASAAPAKSSDYDLSELLRKQQAARLEAELAGLKGAYEKSMAGYNATEERLPAQYIAARNASAAQDARARRAFDERAAASGLNSGVSGQEELARSSLLQKTLAEIDREEAKAKADISLAKANLTSDYENAVAAARASGDATLAEALYKELVRVQEMESRDAQESLGGKPALTAAQTLEALKSGIVNDTTRAAYEYYFGQPYTAPKPTTPKPIAEPVLIEEETVPLAAQQSGSGNPLFDALMAGREGSRVSVFERYADTLKADAGARGSVSREAGGAFVWNGKRYTDAAQLLSDMEAANLTLAERVALEAAFDKLGIEISFK